MFIPFINKEMHIYWTFTIKIGKPRPMSS